MTTAASGYTWENAVRSLIDDPSKRELVEACYFDLPLASAARRYLASAEWAAMRGVIGEPRGLAIDVGAGNGIVSYALAKDGWRAVAIEPDPSNLVGVGAIRALAVETGASVDVLEGYGERLPLGDSVAQLVITRQVLHHARDLSAFAREVARVLAPGGMFVSTRDHVINGPDQLEAFLDNHPLHRQYGGENAFSRMEYRAALRSAGLVIEREIGSLESVINFAPHTAETIVANVARLFGPLAKPVQKVLGSRLLLDPALRLMSAIDRRPGRLISFVCRRD